MSVVLSTGRGSLYDVISCLAAWSYVPSRGFCHWSHIPTRGSLFRGGDLCPRGLCSGGLCPVESLSKGFSVQGGPMFGSLYLGFLLGGSLDDLCLEDLYLGSLSGVSVRRVSVGKTLLHYQHHSYLLTVLLFQHLFQIQYLMFCSTYQRAIPLSATSSPYLAFIEISCV